LSLQNVLEILDKNEKKCTPGQIGNVCITTLNNYSMPLIRYQIGDIAKLSQDRSCSCGRGWPLIDSVMGRQTDHFKTKAGEIIHGEYFTHLFYMKEAIQKFQVVQNDYDHITIKIVVTDQQEFDNCKESLIASIKKVMGAECKVDFELVDNIPQSKSGKFQYTISKINQ